MEATIYLQELQKETQQDICFKTDKGQFRVKKNDYDGQGDNPNPDAEILRGCLGRTIHVEYRSDQFTPQGSNKTLELKYITKIVNQNPTQQIDSPQTVAQASQSAVASAGAQHTQGNASASADAIQSDDMRIVVNYQGEFRSPMMSFVSDLVQAALGTGQYGPNDIGVLTKAAVTAWEEVPQTLEKLRSYATDTDEFSRIHEREIKSEDPDDLPPVEAYENG